MHRRRMKGMGTLGPKPAHVKKALGPGFGRRGMTGTHTVKQPLLHVGRGRKR